MASWACVHWETSYHYTSPCLNVRVSGCENDRLTLEVEGHLSISAVKSHGKFPDDYNYNAMSRSFVTSRELVVLASLFPNKQDMAVHLTQAEIISELPSSKNVFSNHGLFIRLGVNHFGFNIKNYGIMDMMTSHRLSPTVYQNGLFSSYIRWYFLLQVCAD